MSLEKRGKYFPFTLVVCISAGGLYLAFLAVANWRQSVDAIRSVNAEVWMVVLSLSIINYLLRFWRWSLAIKYLIEVRISALEHFLCYVAGFAFTATPGKVGEAIRTLFLERRGVPKSVSLSAFVFERVLDLLAIAILATLVLIGFPSFVPAVVGGAVLLFFVVLMLRPRIYGWLGERFKKAEYISAKNSLTKLFGYRSGTRGLVIGLLSWALEGLGLYFVLTAMGSNVTPFLAVGVYGVSVLAGALSFIPGGIGGTEAVMVGILVACGVPFSVAVAGTLVCRIATLWFAVAIGLLALPAVLMRRRGKNGN